MSIPRRPDSGAADVLLGVTGDASRCGIRWLRAIGGPGAEMRHPRDTYGASGRAKMSPLAARVDLLRNDRHHRYRSS